MVAKEVQYPPVLLKYLKMFQDDPKSRIFAPLAEAYRKIGLIDEAIEICLEGLDANPGFSGGLVALARAYFDKGNYDKVRESLKFVISESPDNTLAQRLYAQASLATGDVSEALSSLKVILYFNPQDQETQHLVNELETSTYQSGALLKDGKSKEKFRKIMVLQRLLERIQQKSRVSSRV